MTHHAVPRIFLAPLALWFILPLYLLLTGIVAGAEQRFLNIGTGGVTGVYYPTGQHLCRLFNRERAVHGMRCTAESTGGSVFNLNTIRRGDMDVGVVQSDLQYHAWHGTGRFAGREPEHSLRSLFSLHPEPLTLMVRPDSGIERLEDLRGKRVNIGNPGSGQRAMMEELMALLGWTRSDFALTSELPPREMGQALCDNRIDAFVFTVGHPSAGIQEPIATCNARLVSVTGPVIDALIAGTSYYLHAVIPGGMYPGHPDDVFSYGVGATLVSSTRTSDEAAYHLTRAVFENFTTFRTLHPAFTALDRERMVTEGLTAPLHDGARRYFIEAGLIEAP